MPASLKLNANLILVVAFHEGFEQLFVFREGVVLPPVQPGGPAAVSGTDRDVFYRQGTVAYRMDRGKAHAQAFGNKLLCHQHGVGVADGERDPGSFKQGD